MRESRLCITPALPKPEVNGVSVGDEVLVTGSGLEKLQSLGRGDQQKSRVFGLYGADPPG